MNEIWTRWEPIANLAPKYYIDSISDDITGFIVTLFSSEDKNQKLRMTFDNSVDAYKRTDETLRHLMISDLTDSYGRSFYGHWTFFKVTNSSYLQWISEQACTISNDMQLNHFVIVAVDSILDIVNNREPRFEHIHG